jgi:hypothetical protein
MKKIDELIEQLPDDFPDAAETLKTELATLLSECDTGLSQLEASEGQPR